MADWDAHPRCGRDLDHHLYSPEKAALRVLLLTLHTPQL